MTNNTLAGGTDSSGNDVITGGYGNSTLVGGAGHETLGGSGSYLFLFTDGSTQGGVDVVTDFSIYDTVHVSGYGESAAAIQLGAVVVSGNTTITLSDNTKITFLDTSASELASHLVST